MVLRLANGFTVSLDGHYPTDYYDHSAPRVTLANQPAYLIQEEPHRGSGRSSHSILPADLGLLPIPYTRIYQA